MCVLWFWGEGRRQWQELGAAEEGRPCRESPAFLVLLLSHLPLTGICGTVALGIFSRGAPGVTPGLKSMGEVYQEKQ